MRTRRFWIGLTLTATVGAGGAAYALQRAAGSESSASAPSLEDMLAQAMEMSKPTDQHQLLEPLVGTWSYQAKWMVPGGDAITVTGTSENTWILAGRFLQTRSKAAHEKLPFEGLGLMGYDSRPDHQDFFVVGVDTLGTYYVTPRGTWDDTSRSFRLKGVDAEGGRTCEYRQVLRVEGNDRHTFEHAMVMPDGGELKIVEIAYTRVK